MGKVITYRLTLRAPAIVTVQSGDPNTIATRLYLPGALLRGAAAHAWLQQDRVQDPAVDPDFRALFLSGRVRWLDALPEGKRGERLLPAPLSLRVAKGMLKPVYDLAAEDSDDAFQDESGRPRPLEPFPAPFARLDHPTVFYRTPGTSAAFHHQRDRQRGRPVEGGIFTYVSLDPGESFIGHVLIEEDERTEQVKALLDKSLPVGRSRLARYGGAPAAAILAESDAEAWTEAGGAERLQDLPAGSRLVVTLLSDYLDAGPDGQATPGSFLAELAAAGVRPAADSSPRVFARSGLQGGYSSAWHLPLPLARSLAAGSVFVLVTGAPVSRESLRQIEWEGLGARRAEGFGRLCFGLHGQELEYGHSEERTRERPAATAPARPRDGAYADRLIERIRLGLLRAGLDRRLLLAADRLLPENLPAVPRSVLGGLRARVRTSSAEPARGRREVLEWLEAAAERKAGRALERLRLGSGVPNGTLPLPSWIRALLETPAPGTFPAVWRHLDAWAVAQKEAAFAGDPQNSLALLDDDQVRWRYERKLLDAVLTRAMARIAARTEGGVP